MKKQFPWFEIILTVVFISIQLYAAFANGYDMANNWFIRDDAYYYFKVAQNVGLGRGITFDGIHPTNGFHPLWLLVCIPIFALARFDLIIPLRVVLIVMSLFGLGTALLLYRMLKDVLSPIVGVLSAIVWTFSGYIQSVFYNSGMESGIALFCLSLLLYALYKFEKGRNDQRPTLRQIAWLGILAILTTLGRLDLIFFCVIVGFWIVFRDSPIRYFILMDTLLIYASALFVFAWRLGFSSYYDSTNSAVLMVVAGLLIKIPVYYIFGLYQNPAAWKPKLLLKNAVLAGIVSGAALTGIMLAADALGLIPPMSRVILAIDAVICLGWLLVTRFVVYGLWSSSGLAENVTPVEFFKLHWQDWLKEGLVYYGILGGVLGLYMLWNKITFGTASPVSGQIKRWWGSYAINAFGGAPKDFLAFFMISPATDKSTQFNSWAPFTSWLGNLSNLIAVHFSQPRFADLWRQNYLLILVLSVLVFCGLVYLNRRRAVRAIILTSFIPLFIGSWIQILSYGTTGYVSPKEWYWLTEQLFLIFAGALVLDMLFNALIRKWLLAKVIAYSLVAVIGIYMAQARWDIVHSQLTYQPLPPNASYMQAASYLESLTQPGDIIGMTGGGNVAYFIRDRTIVNMDGLINSYTYFQDLQNGTASDYLYQTGMRYIFANPTIIQNAPYRGQYTNRLKVIDDTWGGKYLMRLLPKPEN
ncbi:MAG: hypothetical protein M1282_18540 [Chloroflexi bacterium]|nr:hypothetical protein [Chloroflexota bacterium]